MYTNPVRLNSNSQKGQFCLNLFFINYIVGVTVGAIHLVKSKLSRESYSSNSFLDYYL